MGIITNALNAMYSTNLNRDDVINIGKQIIRAELEFNEKAGISQDDDDLPSFFREETSEPKNLKVTFSKEEFQNFWQKLEE